ncbi:hypothetical protein [Staphylococcus cohnii]|uniref:hypothetical protein n=1 Tax=Staphylococcus cohnii TaxID=29382 RepID=UPI0011A6C442|nr:hypothetical protein [Staphylococcus cohnii]
MELSSSDYLITMRYILKHLQKKDLNIEKTIQSLKTIELDEHHKDDLKFSDEKALIYKAYDCLQHLSDVRLNILKSTYQKEVKTIEELVQKYVFEK